MEKLKTRVLPWERFTQWFKPFYPMREAIFYIGAGILLTGARFHTAPLPASLCLMAALGMGTATLWTGLGVMVGSLLFWSWEESLFLLGSGFLTFIFSWALLEFPKKKWFAPFCATVPALLCGGLLFLSGEKQWQGALIFLLQLLFLFFGTFSATRWLRKPRTGDICFLLFCIVSGCSTIPLPAGLPLGGMVAGATLLLLPHSWLFPAAMSVGIALDWSMGTANALPILALSAMALCLKTSKKIYKVAIYLVAGGLAVLLTGGKGGLLFLSMALGAGIWCLLPPLDPWETESAHLSSVADALEGVYRELDTPVGQGYDSFRKDLFLLQQKSRRRELRGVVASQYRILADFLRGQANEETPSAIQWEPLAEFSQKIKAGNSVCGDRVWQLRRENRFFLLLCDGMGTGEAAMEDGKRAERLLSGLLSAGMATDDALETLNLTAILKEGAGECALDLVDADLSTGEAVLYKWGGAPSYLSSAHGTKKVGTASLPPGIGVGGTHQPQQIRLSLRRGEALILTTDGIGGEVAEHIATRGRDMSPEAMVATMVEKGCSEGEDDGTAVVLKLRPVSAQ
ncbi:MAG: SpoIIE family protein phosphatase [Oscillospiraceae bacterium]|nr:SpoIIE family protein phosphatase [Oscillospiraceae bacterium]